MAENGDDIDQIIDQIDDEPMDVNGYSEDRQKLLDYGIDKVVAAELVKIYKTDKLSPSDLDERALDALKEFSPEDAIQVLKQFCDSNLEHVGNKSAFLCGQMKTFRQKSKQGGSSAHVKGPNETKLKAILDRTGYSLDVTTGQRKYGGPPPDCDPTPPGAGHEIFCGKIPKDVFEDTLIPLFEKCGKIWDLRLMMDPLTGLNRGYCFVTFADRKGAQEAVQQLDNYEIRKGKPLKVNISVANLRLFVGNIPKNKTKDEIKEEFGKRTEGLTDIIIYGVADNPKLKNRGFAFLEYESHKTASTAKRKLSAGRVRVWNCDIIVDWADPQSEPDDDTMSKVKVLYVRNLTQEVTEEELKEKFEEYGTVERCKKIKDYGFVHFEEREQAVKAMDALQGQKIGGLEVEISLAKPPVENKKKELRKKDQDRRQFVPAAGRGLYSGWDDYYSPPRYGPPAPRPMLRSRYPPPPPPPPSRYADPYYDDYYGYDDYDYYGGYSLPPPPRGRPRGAVLPPPPPIRGRGMPPRGPARGGLGPRGAAPVAAPPPARGRGGPRGGAGMRGARGGNQLRQPSQQGGKRKAGGDFSQANSKRRNVQDSWSSSSSAQLLPDHSSSNESQWYQDSYGQNWG